MHEIQEVALQVHIPKSTYFYLETDVNQRYLDSRILLNFIIFSVLSETVRNTINQLLQESRSFNKNDILVHANPAKTFLFEKPVLTQFNSQHEAWKLIKEAQKNRKESGINTLCLAEGFLLHGEGENKKKSPLLLTPLDFKIDRVREELHLELPEDSTFINPYIEHLLRAFDIDNEVDVATLESTLVAAGFEITMEENPCLGNFHHHRYAVLRELESLSNEETYSTPLSTLFDREKQSVEPFSLPTDLLLPADIDHLEVFRSVETTPTVIQGPPGTGKSQALTNLLGKVLSAQKSSIVLSEKRVALEVLLQKLQSFGLDRLGFIVTSDNASRELLKQLEANWHYFEQNTFEDTPNLKLSEQYTSQLQFSLDLLNQQEAVGGITLYEFHSWVQTLDLTGAAFLPNPPSVKELQGNKSILKEIYQKNVYHSIAHFRAKTFEKEDFPSTANEIEAWRQALIQLNSVVPFSTWADLRFVTRQAVLCQNLENHQQKQYADLFKEYSRKQKRFFKLYREWKRVQKELEVFTPKFEWKHQPTTSQVEQLKMLLPASRKDQNWNPKRASFLTQRKLTRIWKRYSELPVSSIRDGIVELEQHQDLMQRKSQLIIDFCDLGVLDPEKELDLLHHSIQSFLQNEWDIIEALSSKQRNYLTESHQLLSENAAELNRLFNLEDNTKILPLLDTVLADFSEIVALQDSLKKLNTSVLLLLKFASSYEQCEVIVANSHWALFRQRFPSFSEFEMMDLHAKASAVLNAQNQESQLFSNQILSKVKNTFQSYQELLNTPARQLSEFDKELKKKLRKGKSILVKEFAKTRSHPTIRELFASEAREWIQLLTPLWFSNPTQVSKTFPLQQGLFDIAIFDEASQIPLQNGLGALQRSKNGIIAGDSQQMGPSAYFKSNSAETVDLLHQASFNWKTCFLKHHYRSLHPELISFSNEHFYNGELSAYPAHGMSSPITHHFIPNGVFVNRKNIAEAQAIANLIEKTIIEKDSLGVVAFSEEQLTCIRKELSAEASRMLQERLDDGTAFFKSLENVQGDECDRLLISFGYAKDANGDFAMRFGPMNTENGRRRLNVLLTRARKQLDFFTSVSYSDFKLSDNESVDLLRLWFAKLNETNNEQQKIQLPFEADYSLEGSTLSLKRPHSYFTEAQEFVTFQSVMESRGWRLKYK